MLLKLVTENGKRTGTGNREPGTGNGEPGTGNGEPGTGNEEPGTGNREPAIGNREPGTGNREPGTGNREPGTGNREPRTGNRKPAFSRVLGLFWLGWPHPMVGLSRSCSATFEQLFGFGATFSPSSNFSDFEHFFPF